MAAHGAVVSVGEFLFIVHAAGCFGVEGKLEVVFPIQVGASGADLVVPVAGAGQVAGDVGGMGGDLVGDDALTYIIVVG